MPCSPGMRRCRRDCLHRAMVLAYRDARIADESRAERETYGYATELRQLDPPILTFRAWLRSWRGSSAQETA